MATDEFGEPLRRLFVPAWDPCTSRIPLPQLIIYNPQKQVSQLQMTSLARPQPSPDASSVVVHIDGACRGNGTPNAKAAFGVYVGPHSRFNTNGLVHPSQRQTSTRAEIAALDRALDVVCEITEHDFQLSRIKIATDSKFLVQAMSQWMEGWLENGGANLQGRPVAHFEKLRELHERLDEMEYGDDGGVKVQFWHVPREMNGEADALANAVLDAYA